MVKWILSEQESNNVIRPLQVVPSISNAPTEVNQLASGFSHSLLFSEVDSRICGPGDGHIVG